MLSELTSTAIAYAIALFAIGGLAGLVVMPLSFVLPPGFKSSWLTGFLQSVIIYFAAKILFHWIAVPYFWFSYLVCLLAPAFSDGNRLTRSQGTAAFNLDQGHAAGLGAGAVCALAYHFIG